MPPPVIVKSYKGRRQSEAAAVFMQDASHAGLEGYRPVSQSWSEGGRTGAASFFVALGVLCLVLGLFFIPLWLFAIVFLVIGVVSGKGDGLLTVTYQRPDHPEPVPWVAAPAPAQPTISDSIQMLADARDRALITPEEYETKKAELLGRM